MDGRPNTVPIDAGSVHVHVPTSGDHYSAATGSATMAVIHELSRVHESVGGRSRVIVGRGTRHDYVAGECVEVPFIRAPARWHKIVDAGLTRLGWGRPVEISTYRPAMTAIDARFEGSLFLYNLPGVIPDIKRLRPRARVCLYAVNALFRTYTRSEVVRTVGAADRIICCSQFIADDLTRRLGKACSRIRVVHHGVDVERLTPPAARPQAELPTILFVGRMVREKGADLLIRAAVRIASGRRQFNLRVVGSHGYAATTSLTAYERELRVLAGPIRSRVTFKPAVDRIQLLKEYRAADIVCVPSNWDDPFPLVVLESMACGVPTIASGRGGIREVGEGILYFQPPDVDELAERLAYLVDDPSAREEWGSRGRAAVGKYTSEIQYRALLRALE